MYLNETFHGQKWEVMFSREKIWKPDKYMENWKKKWKHIIKYGDYATSYRSSHRSCSVEKMFLQILQNSQESTCTRVSFQPST